MRLAQLKPKAPRNEFNEQLHFKDMNALSESDHGWQEINCDTLIMKCWQVKTKTGSPTSDYSAKATYDSKAKVSTSIFFKKANKSNINALKSYDLSALTFRHNKETKLR